MTMRNNILVALKTQFVSIKKASGYRNTVTTVAIEARGFDDPAVRPGTKPWVGIIPQRERILHEPFGDIHVEWPFEFLAHFEFTPRTDEGLALACSDMTRDLRMALLQKQNLNITGVIGIFMTGRYGSEGSSEAVRQGSASVSINGFVEFIEGFDS